jgi:hypothetical protein
VWFNTMKIRASPRKPSRKSCRPDAGVATALLYAGASSNAIVGGSRRPVRLVPLGAA